MTALNQKPNLLKDPIPKLLLAITIPASLGFFFSTIYNVIDTWVAGKISGEALSALSLTFPVFFIIIAVSSGIGIGVTALIAHELGGERYTEAKHYAQQALSFGVIISLVLSVIGYFSSPFLFKLLGADGDYLDTALLYMQPVFLGSIFLSMTAILNGILNAVGDTKSYRNVLIVTFFVNLALSPALAFGWFIFPNLGILGIALATIISSFLGFVYLFYKVIKTNLIETHNLFSNLKPQKQAYLDIVIQGLPASFSMMTIAFGTFIITYFVSQYGKEAIAGYGSAIRIEQIVLIPAVGLNIAILTLIGQNNGAKQINRVKEIVTVGLKYSIIISTVAAFLIFFTGHYLLKIFTDVPEIINFGTEYLTVAAFISWGYGILFVTDSVLRGLKQPLFPLVVGVIRQVILPIPIFYLVTFTFTLSILGLWWSVFAIVWTSAIISLAYVFWQIKKLKS